jgi:hypothetical protein
MPTEFWPVNMKGFWGPRTKWEDDIKMDFKVILCDVVDSIFLAKNLHQS